MGIDRKVLVRSVVDEGLLDYNVRVCDFFFFFFFSRVGESSLCAKVLAKMSITKEKMPVAKDSPKFSNDN